VALFYKRLEADVGLDGAVRECLGCLNLGWDR
jgi:hypothetical protein